MQKLMKLRCTVSVSETINMYLINTSQFEGTTVQFKTGIHNVELDEEITTDKPTVGGWVHVLQEGQQQDRVSIILPSPSIIFGSYITVHEHSLMPRNVSIKDFQK